MIPRIEPHKDSFFYAKNTHLIMRGNTYIYEGGSIILLIQTGV